MRTFALTFMFYFVVAAGAQQSQTAIAMSASAGALGDLDVKAIDQVDPQLQAERLLERAANRYAGAMEQIRKRLSGWAGKLEYTPQLESGLNMAYNSSEASVRSAAIEINLMAYKVEKTVAAAKVLREQIESDPERRLLGMWTLALLANRGVDLDETRALLRKNLRDSDELVRQWAVNSLAIIADDTILEHLLDVFAHDESMEVRERAGCALTGGGMITNDQKLKIVPGLLRLLDDPTLNATTQGWVMQALTENSGQRLGKDKEAWLAWYSDSRLIEAPIQ